MEEKYIIFAINLDSKEIFDSFAMENPSYISTVERNSFIGTNEVCEFIMTISTAALSALSTYLIAKVQNSKSEIKIKKGDVEIELKNTNITPESVMELILKLEQKND